MYGAVVTDQDAGHGGPPAHDQRARGVAAVAVVAAVVAVVVVVVELDTDCSVHVHRPTFRRSRPGPRQRR